MNIFVVDRNPIEAADALCDIHVNKMIVESMQMLTTALKQSGLLAPNELPFRKDGITRYSGNAHPHHPCTKWVGEHLDKPTFTTQYSTDEMQTVERWIGGMVIHAPNYCWLYSHTEQLLQEFEKRYGKTHSCLDAFKSLPQGSRFGFTNVQKFVQAMPDEFKIEQKYPADSVKAYRQYYHTKVSSFKTKKMEWAKGTDAPDWWMQGLADYIKEIKEIGVVKE